MREMHAAELMTPDPVVVDEQTTIVDVARELERHEIGSIPVVESHRNKRLVGVITDRDVAVRCVARGHDPSGCTAERHMTQKVRTATVEDDVQAIMRTMQAGQVRRIPVVDDAGRVIGIIAQADLAVDAVGERSASEIDVAYTLDRISRPAHPQRKGAHS